MKNKFLVILAGILLVIILIIGTYAWYLFFLRGSANYSINYNSKYLQSGSLLFKDYGNSVYDANAESIKDDVVSNVPAYAFDVINTGKNNEKYNLYIEDLPVNSIHDGCTEATLLERNQLKYQLKLNGEIIKDDYLSNIADNILDTRNLAGDKTNSYELRIYIHDKASDWTGKHYHYKVLLNQ